jgi:trans-aconitate 2-methyltransferase
LGKGDPQQKTMNHEFDGEKYKQASAHQKEWGTRLIEELDLRGDERVLDLGCGDGALTARLAELVPHGAVVGIDASEGMIETALKHVTPETTNLTFQLRDINELDFANEFDVVFSNATLHWIRNHRALLRNVYRALRLDGALRFNFAGEGNCAHFYRIAREAMDRPEFRPLFARFEWPWYMPGVEEYEELARSFPFREVRVWGENADRFFSDEDTMVKWVDQPSLVPFLAHVEQEHRAGFRQFVVERMIAVTRQSDGRCFETFRRVNVWARK